jgi:hypothetical protein
VHLFSIIGTKVVILKLPLLSDSPSYNKGYSIYDTANMTGKQACQDFCGKTVDGLVPPEQCNIMKYLYYESCIF